MTEEEKVSEQTKEAEVGSSEQAQGEDTPQPGEGPGEHNPDGTSMYFTRALLLLFRGKKLARSGWNGKDMFIFLVQGSTFLVSRPPLLGIYEEGTEINYQPHIDMRTADGTIVPWLASQSDILANDWEEID